MTIALTNEIVKRIFENIGISVIKGTSGHGICNENFLLARSMVIEYDDNIVRHNVYAGKLDLKGKVIRGLLIDLSTDGEHEFLFLCQMDSFPVHAVHIIDQGYGNNSIMVYDKDRKSWKAASIYIQSVLLAGFERVNSVGILWDNIDNIDDIYGLAVSFVQSAS